MGDPLVPPKGLAHYWGSKLWAEGCLASHNLFCTCQDPGGHLTAAIRGELALFFEKKSEEKCLSTTTTSPSGGNMPTSEGGDGSGDALEGLLQAFEGDTGGENK